MLTNEPLPAISLWQPFASLIAIGVKPFETRDYPPPLPYCGRRIAIHAAKRKPRQYDMDEDVEAAICKALGVLTIRGDALPLGAVVCTAYLAGACKISGPAGMDGVAPFNRKITRAGRESTNGRTGIQTDLFGDYRVGRWCWELRDIEALTVPVPGNGRQGWWRWYPMGQEIAA